jgi:hypothetical protein
MATEKKVPVRERIGSVSQALAATRKMQRDWLKHGLNFVDLYVEDWSEDCRKNESQGETVVASIQKFLSGDDPVAVIVCNLIHPLENSPNAKYALAQSLAYALELPRQDNQRLFAVKTALADKLATELNQPGNSSQQTIDLLALAASLLTKLEAIAAQVEHSETATG